MTARRRAPVLVRWVGRRWLVICVPCGSREFTGLHYVIGSARAWPHALTIATTHARHHAPRETA